VGFFLKKELRVTLIKYFSAATNNTCSEPEELKNCLRDGVDIFWVDQNLNNALRKYCLLLATICLINNFLCFYQDMAAANGHLLIINILLEHLRSQQGPEHITKFINHQNSDR
jgi:hypothetical protein